MSIQDKINAVQDVKIDEGTFKYIQIRINGKDCEKIIIRGFAHAEYHADIFDECYPQLKTLGLTADCIGGGRIKHDASAKTLFVYGYSMGFGRADHTITVSKLKESYPNYEITWSNEGY